MPRKERDYAAEYAKRIESRPAGFSKEWARGRPGKDEISRAAWNRIVKAPEVDVQNIPNERTPWVANITDPKTGKVSVLPLTDAQLDKLSATGILDEKEPDRKETPARKKSAKRSIERVPARYLS